MTRVKGFTLVELMVVVALVAITAAIALPNLANFIRDNRVQSQAEELNSIFQYARSEAVTRRAPVTVSVNGGTGKVAVTLPDSANAVLRNLELGNGVTANPSSSTLDFRANGTASAAMTVTLCSQSGADKGYQISVQGSGRVALHPRGKDANSNNLGSC